MTFTVAQLADRTDLSAHTVRYYERAGLLPAPPRSVSGYRIYDEHLVDRLRFIKGAQRTGLKLRQIRELLEISDRGACPCGHTDALLHERIAEIDREITELKDVRRQLIVLRERLPALEGEPEPSTSWPCEKAFIEVGSIDGRRTKP
jgi:DNA-binding transcriptional MerR regulator